MSQRTETMLAGEYFLAVAGLAMIRRCVIRPSATKPRVEEIRRIVEQWEEFPNTVAIQMTEHDVEDGYTRWAPRYDGPNPAISTEEPVVHPLLEAMPVGVALDAACGTGRHAAKLAALGHRVIGVDSTEAMLDIAGQKVPSGDFRLGRLEDLPVEDSSVDLITCALSLSHVTDIEPVMREFARVLRPGGAAVLSDMHPVVCETGGAAAFPEEDITKGIPFVVNLPHHVSEYVAAFNSAGFGIRHCIEPRVNEDLVQVFPSFDLYPDATRQAFVGLPYLLIWHIEHLPG
jgi:ubiquinone/menaquinone biosynthesis C-methylase UbiE